MKRLLITFFCLVFACVFLFGCQAENQSSSESKSEATVDEAANSEEIKIETKYCVLKYPSTWGDSFSTKINEDKDYTVIFMYADKPVFDIVLNGSEGSMLGSFKSGDENVTVRVKSYEFDAKDENYQVYRGMQDNINYILENLTKDYGFTADVNESNDEVFEIEASKATLCYPQKWQDVVKTTVDGDTVSFTYNDTKLFDIVFGESEDGDLLGTYDGTKVYIIDYPLDKTKLSSDDVEKMTAMKEDINVIIDNLSKDEKFSKSTE